MKDMLSKIKYILTEKEKRSLWGLFAMMLVGGCLELVGVAGVFPLITYIVDGEKDNLSSVIYMAIFIIAVYICKNLFLALMYRTIFGFVYRGRSALSTRLFHTYMSEPYAFHLDRNYAILQRAVRGDAEGCYMVIKDLLQIMSECIICTILTVLLFVVNPIMALVLTAMLGLCVGSVYIVSRKTIKKLGREDMEYGTMMNQWLMQGIGGIKEIILLGREKYFTDKFGGYSKASSGNQTRQQLWAQIPRMITETVCIAVVMVWIIIVSLHGDSMLDTLPTLGIFAVAAFRLLPSVGKINGLLAEYNYFKPRIDFIYDDLKEIEKYKLGEKDTSDVRPMGCAKSIAVDNIAFGYEGSDVRIFDGVSMEIKSGESVALIGPSGEGKTTLADLIMGLLSPEKGCIRVDGADIRDNMPAWYRSIGYVPQNIYLSDDSIRNNIAFGVDEQDIDEERVKAAAGKAQLIKHVESLDKGFDTVIGERGVRLSGGQCQRIGIARALYSQPDVLVLDEATSSLDNDTEAAVMEAIENLHGKMTIIIIAHRLSTIEKCDRIFRVEAGKLTEE